MASEYAVAKHTPGPWRKGPTHKDGSYAIHAAKASIIHAMPFASSIRHAEANARLIAAAPDLLEACKGLVAALLEVFPMLAQPSETAIGLEAEYVLAEIAIAKAEFLQDRTLSDCEAVKRVYAMETGAK